jgi:hypothetical protein
MYMYVRDFHVLGFLGGKSSGSLEEGAQSDTGKGDSDNVVVLFMRSVCDLVCRISGEE